MLEHTFCHIPGVGLRAERGLWLAGLHTWRAAETGGGLSLSLRQGEILRAHARESAAQLAAGNVEYFADRLPASEQWRLFAAFRQQAAYLDIETTGLGGPGDAITTIVLYDGRSIYPFVQGENLADFAVRAAQYRLLVTYNGKSFDLPFIRRCLGIPMGQAHIDLRHLLSRLGYRGGLKGCERQLGLARPGLEEVDGYFAVLLWREYETRGDPRVLETLLAYNTLDVLHLEALMVLAYNQQMARTPFTADSLSLARLPVNPFRADPEIIRRIRRGCGWG
jgi:uncharacterized protein